jgi:hypothetical protein
LLSETVVESDEGTEVVVEFFGEVAVVEALVELSEGTGIVPPIIATPSGFAFVVYVKVTE